LSLTLGADAHLTPELLGRLRAGTAPSLAGGRYFLLEPPHTVAPPRFRESMFDFVAAGYVPVLTHPERLTWIRGHYGVFVALVKSGVWMQVTAGSLTGRFGKEARYFGEKMLDDGLVHVLATDAHSARIGRRCWRRAARQRRKGLARTRRNGSSSNARRRFSTTGSRQKLRPCRRSATERPKGGAEDFSPRFGASRK
jgi:tyrosine-protein phosphatase YwqE